MTPLTQFAGVLVSLTASFVDALGLNLQRRDHIKEAKTIKPRHECMRPLWHLGLYLYVGSQVVGSTLVLLLLSPQQAAPLGALSLIFNFLFARHLVGTLITKRDIIGTFVVLFAILTLILSDNYSITAEELAKQKDISLDSLKANFKTTHFMVYFIIINSGIALFFSCAIYLKRIVENPDRGSSLQFINNLELDKLSKAAGLLISAVGGILASETLLLVTSGIRIIENLFAGRSAFEDSFSFFIAFLLILTALLQVYCLNSGLKLADSIIVVPVFACTYNVFTLSNALFYFNLFDSRPWWFYFSSTCGVLILSSGIFILAYQDKPLPDAIPSLKKRFLKKSSHRSKMLELP